MNRCIVGTSWCHLIVCQLCIWYNALYNSLDQVTTLDLQVDVFIDKFDQQLCK